MSQQKGPKINIQAVEDDQEEVEVNYDEDDQPEQLNQLDEQSQVLPKEVEKEEPAKVQPSQAQVAEVRKQIEDVPRVGREQNEEREKSKKKPLRRGQFCVSKCSNPICCTGRGTCRYICFGPKQLQVSPKAWPRLGYILLHFLCCMIAFIFMFTKVKPNSSFGTYLEAIRKPYGIGDPVETDFNNDFSVNEKQSNLRLRNLRGGRSGGGRRSSSKKKIVINFNATNSEINQSQYLELSNAQSDDFYGHEYYEVSPMVRMTLALSAFHILTFFIILPRSTASAVWHDGCWPIKLALILGIWYALFRVNIEYLLIWVRVAAFGTYAFSGAMIVATVHGAHRLNEFARTHWKQETTVTYITWGLNILSIALLCGCFWMFTPSQGTGSQSCGLNVLLIITTFGIVGITVGLKFRGDSSPFTKAFMSFWFTYLIWNALADQPAKFCNALLGRAYAAGIQCLCQIFCAVVALAAVAITTATVEAKKDMGHEKESRKNESLQSHNEREGAIESQERHTIYRLNVTTFIFQFVMILAPCFYFFVFFNWGTLFVTEGYVLHYPAANGFWTKVIFQWCSFGAYFFSQSIYAFVEWTDFDIEEADDEDIRRLEKAEEDDVANEATNAPEVTETQEDGLQDV